jgi:hypothetical protein
VSMRNPFQTFAHCLLFARRRAALDGDTFHVVATRHPDAPHMVLADRELFARQDFKPDDIEASIDPFPLGRDGAS